MKKEKKRNDSVRALIPPKCKLNIDIYRKHTKRNSTFHTLFSIQTMNTSTRNKCHHILFIKKKKNKNRSLLNASNDKENKKTFVILSVPISSLTYH